MIRAFAFALVLLILSGSAWPDECDSLLPPSVTVKRLEEPLSLITNHNHREITVLASTEHRPEKSALGLTRANATVKFDVKTSSFVDHQGRWECASPQIVVSFGYSPMTVYVASEFPKGSCAFNEIYQHELRHVKTYQDHLASIEREIAETLNRRFATGGPWRGPVGQAHARLEKELHERWMPYIKQRIASAESAQKLIDTPQEYARVGNSCHGEIKRLIR